MTWTRLSDNFADRPDVLSLSDAAFRAHVHALVWCNKQLTDGRVPERAVGLFTTDPDVVSELVDVGMWTPEGTAYVLDWSDQEPAERVLRGKEHRAEKQARYRDRKSRHDAGDHSVCDPRFCKSALPVTKPVTLPRSVTGTRPVPSRPLGRDREQGAPTAPGAGAPTAPGALKSRHVATVQVPMHDWE